MVKETTLGKILEGVRKDLSARGENWKGTLKEVKERLSPKEAGKPLIFGEDTIIGRHSKRAREITKKTLERY